MNDDLSLSDKIIKEGYGAPIYPDTTLTDSIILEKDVRDAVLQLQDFVGNSRFKISDKSLKELYDKITKIFGSPLADDDRRKE